MIKALKVIFSIYEFICMAIITTIILKSAIALGFKENTYCFSTGSFAISNYTEDFEKKCIPKE